MRGSGGPVVAEYQVMTKTKQGNSMVRWIASSTLVVIVAGLFSGCYVETRRPVYHRPHRVVVYR